MVSFSKVVSAITKNVDASFLIETINMNPESVVNIHRMSKTEQKPPLPPPPVSKTRIDTDEEMSLSIPTPSLRIVPVIEHIVEPKPAVVETKPAVVETKPAVVATKPVVETKPPVVETKQSKHAIDPITIGISQRDPMYEVASASVKITMECEEARIIESNLSTLYKNESGRSRGWVKTQLEPFIQVRAASGGKVMTKDVFQWNTVLTDKTASALLDFVCIAKGIRVAVWFEKEKQIGIWPASDSETMKTPEMYHVSSEGVLLKKSTVFVDGWTIRSAMAVEHSLEKLTLDELSSLGEKIGIMNLTGKKAERVRVIATTRTEQRLR